MQKEAKVTEVFATIVATAENVNEARAIATGQCSFLAKLSANGAEPTTHYMGSGYMDGDVVESLRVLCDVSDEQPADAMTRLGLVQVVESEEL